MSNQSDADAISDGASPLGVISHFTPGLAF